jgi:hypothetical protein
MKLYCVFGIEYHVQSELIGIYDSMDKAEERKQTFDLFGYDGIEIREYKLNEDIE